MTDDEYILHFGEWCNSVKGMGLKLTNSGTIDFSEPKREEAKEKYWDHWINERKYFRLQKKNEEIINALISLKNQGIKCRLCSFTNGHIQAVTKGGSVLSYYVTTGTISGYWGTHINGLDELIRLCKK